MLHSDAFYYFSKLEANYPKKVKVKEGYQIGFRTLFLWFCAPFEYATFGLTLRNQEKNKTKSVLEFIGGWASTFIHVSRSFFPSGFTPSIVHVFVLFYFSETDNFLSTVPVISTITGKLISTDQVQCRILPLLLVKVDISNIFLLFPIFMVEVM